MDVKKLFQLTIVVLEMMNELGTEIVCLIFDNHNMNRNMLKILCGGSLTPHVNNPIDPSMIMFLLFDSVHLLKCIRNY